MASVLHVPAEQIELAGDEVDLIVGEETSVVAANRTAHLLVVHDGHRAAGFGNHVPAGQGEDGFNCGLDAGAFEDPLPEPFGLAEEILEAVD